MYSTGRRFGSKNIMRVYKAGHGPSGTLPAGPCNAARLFGSRYPEAEGITHTGFGFPDGGGRAEPCLARIRKAMQEAAEPCRRGPSAFFPAGGR